MVVEDFNLQGGYNIPETDEAIELVVEDLNLQGRYNYPRFQ